MAAVFVLVTPWYAMQWLFGHEPGPGNARIEQAVMFLLALLVAPWIAMRLFNRRDRGRSIESGDTSSSGHPMEASRASAPDTSVTCASVRSVPDFRKGRRIGATLLLESGRECAMDIDDRIAEGEREGTPRAGARLWRWGACVIGGAIAVLVLSHVIFGMPPSLALHVMMGSVGPWESDISSIEGGYRHGLPVYLVHYEVEDGYDDLYNVFGVRVCSPMGGLEGDGDGQCPDVTDAVTFPRRVWHAP